MAKHSTPLRDYVSVIIDEAPDKIGGIYVPDANRDKPRTATVVDKGPDASESITEGAKVLLTPILTGSSIKVGDKRIKFIKEEQIIAIINTEEIEELGE